MLSAAACVEQFNYVPRARGLEANEVLSVVAVGVFRRGIQAPRTGVNRQSGPVFLCLLVNSPERDGKEGYNATTARSPSLLPPSLQRVNSHAYALCWDSLPRYAVSRDTMPGWWRRASARRTTTMRAGDTERARLEKTPHLTFDEPRRKALGPLVVVARPRVLPCCPVDGKRFLSPLVLVHAGPRWDKALSRRR